MHACWNTTVGSRSTDYHRLITHYPNPISRINRQCYSIFSPRGCNGRVQSRSGVVSSFSQDHVPSVVTCRAEADGCGHTWLSALHSLQVECTFHFKNKTAGFPGLKRSSFDMTLIKWPGPLNQVTVTLHHKGVQSKCAEPQEDFTLKLPLRFQWMQMPLTLFMSPLINKGYFHRYLGPPWTTSPEADNSKRPNDSMV